MKIHSSDIGGSSRGSDISAAWMRWHGVAQPGKWVANISAFSYDVCVNVDCVIDDFGNIVAVQS